MTWFGQVRHVMMKDLRQSGVMLLLYSAVVAMTTESAFTMVRGSNSILPGSADYVILLGMLVVAVLVQADSPTRNDAFWATRPLYPTAVFAAKLGLILAIVVGLPLLGQFIVLSATDVAPHPIVALLPSSAWQYTVFLFAALVVAARTKDLTMFVVVGIAGCVVGAIIVGGLTAVWHGALGVTAVRVLRTVGFIGALAFVATLYRTRDVDRGSWLAGVVTLGCAFAPAVLPSLPGGDEPPPAQRATLAVEFADRLAQPGEIALLFRVHGAPSSQRFLLIYGVARLHLRDGSALRVALQESSTLYPDDSMSADLRWMNGPLPRAPSTEILARLSARQQKAVGVGIDSITVEGRLAVVEQNVLGTAPLQEHVTLPFVGGEMHLTNVTLRPDDVLLALVRRTLDERGSGLTAPPLMLDRPPVALVNQARGQAVWLKTGAGSSRAETLVLPGPTFGTSTETYSMGLPPTQERAFPVDAAWIHESRIMLVEWRALGSYPVHASVAVPH